LQRLDCERSGLKLEAQGFQDFLLWFLSGLVMKFTNCLEDSMRRVAEKLAAWHRLVEDLADVRSSLQVTPAGPERNRLKAEVRRLTAETDVALDAVSAAIAAEHKSVGDPGETQLPIAEVGRSSSNWPQRRKGPLH
jgi:hypothetical protein